MKLKALNRAIDVALAYFNSISKTFINLKYILDKSVQEILCRIDN